MTFYQITEKNTGNELYVNPQHIEFYQYLDENTVHIITTSLSINIDKFDFNHIMFLEGAQEYWNGGIIMFYKVNLIDNELEEVYLNVDSIMAFYYTEDGVKVYLSPDTEPLTVLKGDFEDMLIIGRKDVY